MFSKPFPNLPLMAVLLTYHCEVSLPLLGVEGRAALGDLAHVAARRVEVDLLQHDLVHAHLQELEDMKEDQSQVKNNSARGLD